MLIQDFRRMSIVAKKIADRCDNLARESEHRQNVQWRGKPYTVDWGFNFDEEISCFKPFVRVCDQNRIPLAWPIDSSETDGEVLVAIVGNHLIALEVTDEWPSTLPEEWLKEQV